MSLISDAVAIADTVTKALDLPEEISVTPYEGPDGYGGNAYGDPVTVNAIVDQSIKESIYGGAYAGRLTAGGTLVVQTAKITILETMTPNGNANRKSEPIDPRDKIVLKNGHTGPILAIGPSVTDPDTGNPYMLTVVLG
jgi:hypothetical protein